MPMLAYPDFTKPFIITTDASSIASGAYIAQEINGEEKPIAFASKAFTKGEANKSTIEKELTAIHWAVKHFRPYVYGYRFTIRTDHKPLIYIFSLKNPSSKLTRMRLDLEEYSFDIEYIKGSLNVVSDALSRISIETLLDIKSNLEEPKNILKVETRSSRKNNINNNKEQTMENSINDDFSKAKIIYTNRNLRKVPIFISSINNNKISVKIIHNRKNLFTKEYDINCKVIFSKNGEYHRNNDVCRPCIHLYKKILRDVLKLQIKAFKINSSDQLFDLIDFQVFENVSEVVADREIIINIFRNQIEITSKEERLKIIAKFHNHPLTGGHTGIKRTCSKILEHYTWPRLRLSVTDYVKKCKTCQLTKTKISHKEEQTLVPTPEEPFHTVQIDLYQASDPSLDSGSRNALTIQCELTKYIVVVPVKSKSAQDVAKAIVDNFILIYGNFRKVKTDLGTEVVNSIFKELQNLLNFEHKTSTPYHHETIGSVERNHRELNTYLRNYLNSNAYGDWVEWAKTFAFFYNTTPFEGHGYTPFELVFGRKARMDSLTENVTPVYNFDSYVKKLKFRLEYTSKRVKEFLNNFKINQKTKFDIKSNPIELKVNDNVVLKNNAKTNKFNTPYIGPYTVVELLENNNIKISKDNKEKIVHKNQVSKI